MSAIHDAVKSGDLAHIQKMIEADPYIVSARTVSMATPLHIAALHSRCDVLSLLLDKGAVVDARTSKGIMALHYAAMNGNVDCIRMLLERGADIEAQTRKFIVSVPLFLFLVISISRVRRWLPSELTLFKLLLI